MEDEFKIPIDIDRQKVKKWIKIGAGIGIPIVVFFIILLSLMDFLIQIEINQQLYALRLNLNWWAVTFFQGLGLWAVPLICFGILAILVTVCNPATSISLEFLKSIAYKIRNISSQPIDVFIFQKPSKKASLLWNYLVIALAGGFLIGWSMTSLYELLTGEISLVNLDMALYTINKTGIEWLPPLIFEVLLYPIFPFFNIVGPSAINMEYLYVYIYFYLPLISLIILFFIIKVSLDLAKAFVDKRSQAVNNVAVMGRIFMLAGLAVFWLYCFFPLAPSAFDYTFLASIAALTLIIGGIAFIMLGGICMIAGLGKKPSDKVIRRFGRTFNKTFFSSIIMALLVGSIFIVGFTSAGIGLLFADANWNSWTWGAHTQTEIYWTREAAGISDITQSYTDWLNENASIVDLNHVRQYDQSASRSVMIGHIGTIWENIADSDILYLNNKEYWIAPRTIKADVYSGDFINQHIKYTHSRGFIMADVNTGHVFEDQAEIDTEFGGGVNETHPIYFGELPDNGYTLLGDYGYDEVGGYSYNGTKDVTLNGLYAWWLVESWGFKTFNNLDLLVKRDINDRVGDMLLPYLKTGDDPYLAFNPGTEELFYVVDIILDFPAFSYMRSNIMRWLGFCLVNVENGEMTLYQVPGVVDSLSNFEFINVYLSSYTWNTAIPVWLEPQLKYPETLQEAQLQVHYKYHVDDRNTWFSGEDFYERPESTDLHHVLYDLAGSVEFVGTTIVEFKGSTGQNLAGIYINEYGDKYGKTTFYKAGNETGLSDFRGIEIALAAFTQRAEPELTLLESKRYGNFLLYPFEDTLWYVIPVYSTGGSYQTLQICALVDAFDVSQVYWGSTVQDAYNELIGSKTSNGSVTMIASASGTMRVDIPLNILATITNEDNVSHAIDINCTIKLTPDAISDFNISVLWNSNNITAFNNVTNVSYAIQSFSLIPDEIRGIPFQILFDDLLGGGVYGVDYVVELYVDGSLSDTRTFAVTVYP